jgi:hypothetical protein
VITTDTREQMPLDRLAWGRGKLATGDHQGISKG